MWLRLALFLIRSISLTISLRVSCFTHSQLVSMVSLGPSKLALLRNSAMTEIGWVAP